MDQELSQVENKVWDNVIIGTGMGSAALGYALAKAGQSVLFCEKGQMRVEDNSTLIGFAEKNLYSSLDFEFRKKVFEVMGRLWEPIFEYEGVDINKLFPMLGSGVGGSSAIYGMVLERFFPFDFENNDWPIQFSDLEPFYNQAESLFEVHGEADPLKFEQIFSYSNRKYQEIHPVNKMLIKYLHEKKYHPYLLPLANKRYSDCITCQGFLCNKNCKKDAWNTLIQPALKSPFVKLLVESEVISLEANSDCIYSAITQIGNKRFNIKGKRFMLGAGAIYTPKILLQSKSQYHPDGIGNHFSVVGKFLMRHLVDLYALTLSNAYGYSGSAKEFGVNDFYFYKNKKFGNIQSFGALPAEDLIANDLIFKLMQNNKSISSAIIKPLLPLVKKIIKHITQSSTLLAATMEDEPRIENSIFLNEAGSPCLKYHISPIDQEKLKLFRSHILKLFAPFKPRIIKMAESNEMLGHICGTCRMGSDPRKSVIDQYNKVHGVKNLYIIDSSFLPTSGGTNPALTIVANSLRVADHLIKKTTLLFVFFFSLLGCTWNASIKSLDQANSNPIIDECIDAIPTSALCKVSQSGKIVTSIIGASVTSWANPTASDTVSALIPDGYYASKICSFQENNLIPSNIRSGTNIFGVVGGYTGAGFQSLMASTALRDAGIIVVPSFASTTTSNQITLDGEANTYAGADLPTTGGYNYRDIPDTTKDDDGDSGVTCKYAPRPTNDCGITQNTITARVVDCATQNPSTSTWNGSTQCNAGEGIWKLVTRNGANKEVWQDQRSGLLWSSIVSSGINWCQASGNTQMAPLTFSNAYNNAAGTPIVGNGTIGSLNGGSSSAAETITITFTSATTFTVSGPNCGGGSISGGGLTTSAGSTVTWSSANRCSFVITQGSTNFAANDKFVLQSISASSYSCVPGAGSGLQPASPVSYCAEVAGVNAPAGENWGTGVYLAAKGGMGKTATAQSPSVRWRMPTLKDLEQANINGIRFVMPDMGISGTNRPSSDGSTGGFVEWSSTLPSGDKTQAWAFYSGLAGVGNFLNRGSLGTRAVRCVGR